MPWPTIFPDGTHQPLCTFAGQDADLFARLPVAEGVGIALQMTDGTTRVLRMSEALERHLRQEWTPYLLANAADIKGERSAAGAAVSGQQGSAHDLAAGKTLWATAQRCCWASVPQRIR